MNQSRLILAALLFTIALSAAAAPRERLLESAKASEKLSEKAAALPADAAKNLGIQAELQEDRALPNANRFARESDLAAYLLARPWSSAYLGSHDMLRSAKVEAWPTPADAADLRALLNDKDAVVRSLAIEALATLHQPEDVPRIANLLEDKSPGAIALGFSQQMSSMPWRSQEADPILPDRTWAGRSVQTYAREALHLMTGHRFDGKDPRDATFADWWKTHDLGRESLWFWQERLMREASSAPAFDKDPLNFTIADNQRWQESVAAHRAKLRAQSIKEIRQLPPEVEAKLFLITRKSDLEITGPVNSFFPEGLPLRIPLPEFTALIERKRIWPDSADYRDAKMRFLTRAARIASELSNQTVDQQALRAALRTALQNELPDFHLTPILYSRLLPAATPAQINDANTREGYLQKSLAAANQTYARNEIAAEMVRTNLPAHWPVLEKSFYADRLARGETSDIRQAIFQSLGESPHTPEKLRTLVTLIQDPRNDTIFTQENRVMGMDMYRVYAVQSLNAIAGKEFVPFSIRQDMGIPANSKAALAEFRRLAKEFLARQ